MADNPEFPDCNTCMMIDKHGKLWLFWPIILDNNWESALTNYRTSTDYEGAGAPKWDWQGVVWLKPEDFKDEALTLFDEGIEQAARRRCAERVKAYRRRARRSGWATSSSSASAGSRAASRRCSPAGASCCRSIATPIRSR